MGETSICLGAIVAAHGIKGAVKVQCFTAEPAAITAYGALTDERGERRFELKPIAAAKGGLVARIAGIEDRNAAEALRGTRLYVPRAALPQTANEEYYQADLIGLAARSDDGAPLGTVVAVHNYGAGDLLEVARPAGASLMVPFTRDAVPAVDLAGRHLTVARLPGLMEDEA
jgi:16S rRNA processing protein RimM